MKVDDAVCLSGQALSSGQCPCTKKAHTLRLGSRPNRYSLRRNSLKANLGCCSAAYVDDDPERFRILSAAAAADLLRGLGMVRDTTIDGMGTNGS